MKVLITGGCGYIGYSLIMNLLPNDKIKEIILYDNLYRKNTSFFLGNKFLQATKVKFVKGDILDNFTLEETIKDVDIVIHLAAKASTPFADNNAHEFDQINNWGTANVANAVEKSNSVHTLVFLSSISVYGNTEGQEVTEDSITVPKSFYGISKLKGERHIKRLAKTKKVFIFRSGNVFGYNPCIRMDAVINKLMFDAHYQGKIEIHGNGEQKRAFVSVDCIGKYLVKTCESFILEPGIYNLVNYNLSINEIVEKIHELYPTLEIMHLDQHLKMRSISATSKYKIDFEDCFNDFEIHLDKMKSKFSF